MRPAHLVQASAGRASETLQHSGHSVEDILRRSADFAEPGEMEARILAEDDHTGVGPGLILGTIVLMGSLGLLLGGVLTIIAFNLAERI